MFFFFISNSHGSIYTLSLSFSSATFYGSSQIRQTLKKKTFEEAGIPVKQISMFQAPAPALPPKAAEPTVVTTTISPPAVTEPSPAAPAPAPEPEPEPSTSAVGTQSSHLLLLEPDAVVNDMISGVLTDEKIVFDGQNNLDILGDEFALPPIAGATEEVLDDGIQTDEMNMDVTEEINVE